MSFGPRELSRTLRHQTICQFFAPFLVAATVASSHRRRRNTLGSLSHDSSSAVAAALALNPKPRKSCQKKSSITLSVPKKKSSRDPEPRPADISAPRKQARSGMGELGENDGSSINSNRKFSNSNTCAKENNTNKKPWQ